MMKGARILLTVLTFFAITTAFGDSIVYKWQEDGRTIYSQTPPRPGVEFTIVHKKISKTDSNAAQGKVDTLKEGLDEREKERMAEEQQQERQQESDKIRNDNCQIARNNLQALTSHGQVTIKEDDLYRKLTEEERQERI